MNRLPEPIGSLIVSEMFSVTAVAAHQGCDLKLLTASKAYAELKLPAGPEAAIGIIIHEALEAATRSDESSREVFDRCVEAMRSRLVMDPRRAHFADLEQTKSRLEWRNLRETTAARIEKLRNARASAATHGDPLRNGGARTEAVLSSQGLRLSGRTDKMVKRDQRIQITDFKTGQIFDADGVMLDSIKRQLYIYALLAEEHWPGSDVSLLVESQSDRFPLEWNAAARDAIRLHVETIVSRMPTGALVHASSIARPGNECRRCSVRAVCPAYLAIAPSWWKETPAYLDASPPDIGGTVTAVGGSEGRTNLEIRDRAGRRVKVTGLREPWQNITTGMDIFIFSLEPTGGGRGWDGRRFHPHTFHEQPPDKHARRAWSAALFTVIGTDYTTGKTSGSKV